ncbi:DUF7133 domain-containing protein [Ulvibacterium sp.]|uniref:DUF7133 domain-containing protein n=1 Tax=Ulvibacterium sp. TaxID=2665914 RepID=UPI003CC6071A
MRSQLFLTLLVFGCKTSYEEPKISLDEYQLEDGFNLEVVASEPHLKAPVAIDFDDKGRIWVAQMPGYMNDMLGSDETKPVGNIKILEDLDGDGVVDHSKIFLDSLVMPRALAHVYGGLLYAEPPKLWFVEIEDDKPVHKVLVDSIYAAEGNPEHQPNGLLLNIDNWIYNAKSNFRYRRKNGIWEKEPTTFRGQWGISHDNFGRLYYNDNSRQLLGDYVLPNRMVRNPYFTPKASVNQILTTDQRVYPLHATTVNRGYAKGVLNQDSILVSATAACGPLVYRGGTFPKEYEQNVFVCIPEGNLIKRNILKFTGDSTIAGQAWEYREFLASTDEGFRPVNLNNGPDGSMYIVDMHRGMIGHHAYLSPYLKQKVKGNHLDTLINFGRILKVQNKTSKAEPFPDFETLKAAELVLLLQHPNGWIRNRAQHYLILKKEREAIESLKNLIVHQENPLTQIHALYALEGLDALSFDFLVDVAKNGSANVTMHAVVLMEAFASKENSRNAELLFKDLIRRGNKGIDFYIGSTLGVWMAVDKERFFPQIMTLLGSYPKRPIFHEAILSGLSEHESYVKESLATLPDFDDTPFVSQLTQSIEQRTKGNKNPIFNRASLAEDNRTHGAKMFFEICASCHGINGQGIQGLAPPLMNSEHVVDSERLGLIILHGLEGPIEVNGEHYDFNLAMPGLIRNENVTDKDIADIISYVTNAFSDDPKALTEEKVGELRSTKSRSGSEYTMDELLEYSKK